MICPLCTAQTVKKVQAIAHRDFFHCSVCELLFENPSRRISLAEERARYESHNNDVEDPRYQKFVSPLFNALCERLSTDSVGLDFGAGTGPVLAKMLRERFYQVHIYDPFFAPYPQLLQRQYDFVFACEVVEHFGSPGIEFRKLRSLLRPKGWVAMMTLLRDKKTDLMSWYYLKDPTHLCAYSKNTLQWIAQTHGFHPPEILGDRVVLMRAHE